MRRRTLPEKVAIAATLLAASSCSDHHVSPWGARPGPALSAYFVRPDLAARLAAVDAEARALRLGLAHEITVEMPRGAGKAVVRGYDGQDLAGRAVHAVRVPTPLGVVLALGPLDPAEIDRRQPTELVVESGVFRSGTDLNGDGRLDVIVKGEGGAIAIWHFDALGSGAYEIAMATPPLRAVDVDGDGLADLEGEIPIAPDDPIGARFVDVATFADGRYADTTPAARAWHVRRARAHKVDADAKPAARLRVALERGWHRVLGGEESAENVLRELRREPTPASLRPAFERSIGVIARPR